MKMSEKSATLLMCESQGIRQQSDCGKQRSGTAGLNAKANVNPVATGASDLAHIVLTFDNNDHARALYGQFDENLALIEQRLGVDVRSKGNQVSIRGEPDRHRTGAPRARLSL
jgi:hypothetical protein